VDNLRITLEGFTADIHACVVLQPLLQKLGNRKPRWFNVSSGPKLMQKLSQPGFRIAAAPFYGVPLLSAPSAFIPIQFNYDSKGALPSSAYMAFHRLTYLSRL
jgi:hypothetical protein